MSTAIVAADEDRSVSRKTVMLVAIWAALLTVPLWLPLLGGYTALAGRVLVFGLAAMGLNMLLGFTGVLSFGHAAYFGLGAYGAGLTLRYLVHSTPAAIAVSGPRTTRSMRSPRQRCVRPLPSVAEISQFSPRDAVPAFPGAAKTASQDGDSASLHESASSRAPLPTTSSLPFQLSVGIHSSE